MKRKIAFIVLMILCVNAVMASVAFADAERTIENSGNGETKSEQFELLRWGNASVVAPYISVSKNKIVVDLTVIPNKQSYKVKGYLYIEEKSGGKWTQVQSYKINQTGDVSMTKKYTYSSGCTYRAKADVSVAGEKIVKISEEIDV